jgi:hypothetical protein
VSLIYTREVDVNAKALRDDAIRELSSGIPLPLAMQQIRQGHVDHLRGQGSVVRGLSDEALAYFVRLLEAGLPDPRMLDELAIEVHITPEHRRMFPEIPEKDILLIGRIDGQIEWDFVNVESRA